MASLTVTATEDYSDGNPVLPANIDSIFFTNAASATATFGSNQFGAGLISNTVSITGNALFNQVLVNMSAAGTFSAAGWTFNTWSGADSVQIIGTAGADTITAPSQRASLRGGGGADILNGGGDGDSFLFFASNEVQAGEQIHGGGGSDSLNVAMGSSNDFRLATITSIEMVFFADGTNSTATFSSDQVGANLIATVTGGSGINTFIVEGSNVDLSEINFGTWTAGTDVITINGLAGAANRLIGSAQRDTINGGNLSDTIIGTDGTDTHNGGGGNDVFEYSLNFYIGSDTITGGEGLDQVRVRSAGTFDFTGATLTSVEAVAFDQNSGLIATAVFSAAQIVNIGLIVASGGGNDRLEVAAASAVNLSTLNFIGWNGPGDRVTINGTAGADVLIGSSQNDTFISGGGGDTLVGNGGDDVIVFAEASHAAAIGSIDGGNGIDTLETTVGGQYTLVNETLTGIERVRFSSTAGSTLIFGAHQMGAGKITNIVGDTGGQTNLLSVNVSNNLVDLSVLTFTNWNPGFGFDTIQINGFSGNDTLIGSVQYDRLNGSGVNGGNDTMTGGGGNDEIDGGGGRDVSVYAVAAASALRTHEADGTWTVDSGGDGVDTLDNVEILQFTDRKVVIEDPWTDFNADANSDLLFFQQSTGQATLQLLQNNDDISTTVLAVAGPTWTIQTTGDFNGDGSSDLFWKDSTNGQSYIWSIVNGQLAQSTYLGFLGTEWRAIGGGDFNADGHGDIVWNNVLTGEIYLWTMVNNVNTASNYLGALGAEWQVAAVGDFNGNGTSDLVVRRSTDGLAFVWNFVNGANTGNVSLGSTGPEWKIMGAGDFNKDGTDDLALRNSSNGQLFLWMLQNNAVATASNLGVIGTEWTVDAIADYNADGTSDLALKRDDGLFFIWNIVNAAVSNSQEIGTIGADWVLI